MTKETTSTAAAEDGKYALGETIEYKITVKNAGNVTISDIKLTDQVEGYDAEDITANLDKTELKPGEEAVATFTHEVTEQDILAGSVKNAATAEGDGPDDKDPDPTPGTTEDPTEDPNPKFEVTKETTSTAAAEDGKYALGETIEYKITVKNVGNLTISNIKLTDEIEGYDPVDITANLDKTELKPGEEAVATFTHVVNEEDVLADRVLNEATATGDGPEDKDPEPTPGTHEDPTEDPKGHLTINKVTTSTPKNGTAYEWGETITYLITVLNDGNLTATNVEVKDDLTGDSWTIASLAPGATEQFETSYVVTQEDAEAGSVLNVATATGDSPDPKEPEIPVTPGEDPEPTQSPYVLTIRYRYLSSGRTAAPTYTEKLASGMSYSRRSPSISGYTASRDVVRGVMPARNVEITVWYGITPDETPEEPDEELIVSNLIFINEYETPLGLGALSVNVGEAIE